jgi:hypothetical protein
MMITAAIYADGLLLRLTWLIKLSITYCYMIPALNAVRNSALSSSIIEFPMIWVDPEIYTELLRI